MTNWKNPLNGSWTDPNSWDTGIVPGPADNVSISVAGNYRASLNASSAVAALTIADAGALLVIVDPGGANSFSGDVINAGVIGVDSDTFTGEGGSAVTIGGTLTNTGSVVIGPSTGGLSANSILTLGGLAGTGGVTLNGGSGTQAEMNVLSAAPGTLNFNLGLNGDTLLEYASGQIGTVAASITLSLSGNDAFIADAGTIASNSALTGLTENDGTLRVVFGAQVGIGGNLLNKGALDLDGDSFTSEGASGLIIAGTLTNTGSVVIGPSTGGLSANTTLTTGALAGTGGVTLYGGSGTQAEMNVQSAAPGTLNFNLALNGDTLLEYANGQIGTIAGNVTLSLNGNDAFIADAGTATANSALTGLTEVDGTLRVVFGAQVAVAGNLLNKGVLDLDGDGFTGEGASGLNIAGTLTNTGSVVIGPSTGGLSANTTLTAGALAGTGGVTLYGGSGTQAEMNVLSAAPGTLNFNLALNGDTLLEYASGQIGTVASNVTLSLNGNDAFIADAGTTTANSALTGLTENDGTLRVVFGAQVAVAGNLLNKGVLDLDGDGFTSEGASGLIIAGTLTNTGSVVIGPSTGGLSANTTLTTGALAGTGGITLYGGSGTQAEMNVQSAAPGTLNFNLALNGDTLLEYASGQIGTVASNVTLSLNGNGAFVADAGTVTSNSALTGLTENDGTLRVVFGAQVGIAGNLLNKGVLDLDGDGFTSEGASGLIIAGTLTNTGSVVIGPSTGGLSANTTLTTGALTGTGGVTLYGGSGTQAEMNVQSAAPGTLNFNLALNGDTLLEYANSQIGTVAGNVTLSLNGNDAFVADAGTVTSNSALTGLTEVDGTLRVVFGAQVAVAGNLLNKGVLDLDGDGFTSEGGSGLTIAGTLTNAGSIVIGPSTSGLSSNTTLTVGALASTTGIALHGGGATQAEINVLSAAPGTLNFNLGLDGDSVLQYASGQIGTLASGVTLSLAGNHAFVADAGAATSNSALTGLAENDGDLRIVFGASVAVAGNLLNTGFLDLDGDGFTSEGASGLTVAGTLTNTGSVVIGPSTGGLSANTTLTTGALAGTGGISIFGGGTTQAEMNVLSAAPGTLNFNLSLSGDSLLEYASGQIGTVAGNITLSLNGNDAFIADAGKLTSNSALTGLTENDGTLRIIFGAHVATAGNLTNTGNIDLDGDGFTSEGGSGLTIAGTLTNSGGVTIGPSTGGLSANTTLTVGALAGTGAIAIHGGGTTQAEMDVQSAAPGTLVNNLTLDGDSLLRYLSGQIGTIASGVNVSLSGAAARIADAAATTSNSALAGLTENDGSLRVIFGNAVTIAGNLLNTGGIDLDGDGFTREGGSSINIVGTLTNAGSVTIGPSTSGLSSTDTLTVDSLSNTGRMSLFGASPTARATEQVLLSANNSGSLLIGGNALMSLANGAIFTQSAGTTDLQGTLAATTIDLAGGTLLMDGGSTAGNEVVFTGGGTIALSSASTISPTIGDFLTGDMIEFLGVTATTATPVYSAATGLTTITVTLSGGGTRTVLLAGDYTNANLAIQQSGGNSTLTTNAAATNPAIATVQQTGGNGSLAPNSAPNTLVLNLGTTTLNGPALSASLEVLNSAISPSDLLDGSFAVSGPVVFTNTGFGDFSSIAAGNADTAPNVTLSSGALGQFTETIVFDPSDAATSGVTTPLTPQTIIITGVVAEPTLPGNGSGGAAGGTLGTVGPGSGAGSSSTTTSGKGKTAIAWGDVHMGDYDGVGYNFQAAGEFVLTKSTAPGDTFQVQARMSPLGNNAVSVITMLAAEVGNDRITFSGARANQVEINGAPPALSGLGVVIPLSGGSIQETSQDVYVVNWNTGESMTVEVSGELVEVSISLPLGAAPGTVQGLLGNNSGAANDFALANGSAIPGPITSAQLYGEFANAWRVTQASSLLDYAPGQTTATFTDVNFPSDAVALNNLPASVTANAAAVVSDNGITVSSIAQQAELDYAATGDPNLLAGARFAQATGVNPTLATITPSTPVPVTLGVSATAAQVTEAQGGAPTFVTFSVYTTVPVTHDTVVNAAVTTPGTGFLDAAAFGGTLPTSTVVIPTGAAHASVTIGVPASAFGAEASDQLQLTIATADGTPIFASTAQTVLLNPAPRPGPQAGVGVSAITNGGTFTQNGSSYTLDLGTYQHNTGTVVSGLDIYNTATMGSDNLAGSYITSGSPAYSLQGFIGFGPLKPSYGNAYPTITLDTANTGTFTETITLNPEDVNNTGYSAALTAQTITVTGTIADLTGPTISAPATLTTFQQMSAQFPGLAINDLNAPNQPMTVSLVSTSGTLTTSAPGALAITGYGSTSMSMTGDENQLNAALAALVYTSNTLGQASVTVTATDADRATSTQTVAVTTDVVPVTNAIFSVPKSELVFPGQYSGLGGLSITDPFAQATNEQLVLQLTAPEGDTLIANGSGGAVVTGQGTGTLSISGTVDQINAYLSDGGELLEYLNLLGTLKLFSPAVTGILKSQSGEDLVVQAGGGTEGKFFEVGVEDASFALNQLIGAIPGNEPPSYADHIQRLIKIITASTVLTGDGTIYAFNPAGEFVLASSTQASDSLDVQVRFQPLGESSSASVMTQLAAQVGTDRVTFGAGRTNTVWVDGAPVTLSLNNPFTLSGGEVTQSSSNVYQVSWNTGEVLTVTAQDQYLDASLNPGPNDNAGDLVGLGTDSTTLGNEFTLADGTVLSQPFPSSDLYSVFAASWAVPQQFSILDYDPGQTTATFTNTSFPTSDLTLADLPASIVAMAATVVANAGIIDPTVAAIAEFDYLASGGDMTFVTDDANQFQGLTIGKAQITPVTPPPVAIGVTADQPETLTAANSPTSVLFDLYLTAPLATDTEVDYTVAGALGLLVAGGTATIAAGRTTGQFAVDLPAGSLGSLPTQTLEVDITSPDGTPLFSGTALATIKQTIPGPPPAPVISDLTRLGTFTNLGGGNYSLDLGQIQYGEQLPDITFSIANEANAPSDTLTGSLSATTVEGFNVSGLTLPSALAAGSSYNGLDVTLNFVKFGENTEVITFTPQDTNNTGFSAPLPVETLTITDDVVPPTMVFSSAWGDVHITTYNGLLYNFQAVGEFTLAHSRVPGDSFDIQLRTIPLQNFFGSVSLIQEVGVSLGSDRITFDAARPDTVWVDGVPSAISVTSPALSFAGGSLTQLSVNSWQVLWNTGEEATIISGGTYLNVYDGIPLSEPDQVGGLQGEDAGQANDFQLSDGTVLQQPLTYAQLYGEYADSWRLTQQSSLLDYGPGQNTATFTDRGYPADYFDPNSVPAALLQKAAAVVAANGITDPGLVAAAEEDYLETNDSSFVTAAAPVQQQVATTTVFTPTAQPAPEIAVGVSPDKLGVVEKASGVTPVVFDLSQTETLAIDNTVTYTVVDGGTGFLGSAAFGGVLPTGTATVSANQFTGSFTIDIPNGALGTNPSASLEVSISSSGPVFAQTATVGIANNLVEPGTPIAPIFSDLTTPANLVASTPQTYTLDMGTFALGQIAQAERLSLTNNVMAPADSMTGAFTAPVGSGFVVVGGTLPNALAPTQSYSGMFVTPQTNQPGVHSETITFTPKDVNASGYSVTQSPITIVMTETVTPAPAAGINSPGLVLFPNVHVGTAEQQAVSVSNTAGSNGQGLNVNPSASGFAMVSGNVANLVPGGLDAKDIMAALDTSGAGSREGIVTLAGTSAAGVLLSNSPTVMVFGNVFRQAAATIVPVTKIVHVGDPGTVALNISNTATTDGFSESLIASLAAASGGLTLGTAGPSGDIVAGGSDTSSLTLDFSTAQAGTVSGTANVALTSDGGTGTGSIDGLGTTVLAPQAVPVTITVNNFAKPVFEEVSNIGTFSGSGTSYALDLGTITQGSSPVAVNLGVLNQTTGPSDVVSGSFQAAGSSAFTNSGLVAFGALIGGASDVAPTITLDAGTAGTFSETITLTPTDSNAGGFSSVLPAETLTITGSIAASTGTITLPGTTPAIATVLSATPIDFGNVHVGALTQQILDIGNTATTGSAALDASVQSVSGDANASGPISGLAAGGIDTTSIHVGLDSSAAGLRTGNVVLAFVSDAGTLGSTGLPTQNIAVSGTVYREAATALLPLNEIVHVGDPGTIALPITNSDPSDGFSENLVALLIGASGGLGIAAMATPTGEIAAGQTNTNALALSFATSLAGTVSGTATVGLTSDGSGIDGLGTTVLTAQTVAANIVVDNFADPVLSSNGNLTQSGPDAYVLNLGTATQGTTALSANLILGNNAVGPADWLNGTFAASGSGAFSNSGLAAFNTLTAGGSLSVGGVSLSTSQAGVFSETITLSPTDANAGGFDDPLAARTITVTGTIVAPTGTAGGDVHMVTFDGLHYDFQAVGEYVLTRSTAPDSSFQIQIRTAALPTLDAVSVTTEAAAQVGQDVVTFAVGRGDIVWVDGAPDVALNASNPVQDLAGGQLTRLSSTEFRLTWNTGEALTVGDDGPYLNDSVSLPAQDGAGSIQGLLGSNSGQQDDFQRADGSVIAQPLSNDQIMGELADAWRGNSLLGDTPSMHFIYGDGGQTVTQATASEQTLSGTGILSDMDGLGAIFQGTLAALVNEAIIGFSGKDAIDVTDLNSATASVSYNGSATAGILTVSDGIHNGMMSLSGQVSAAGFHVTSDQHGGSLIVLG